MFLQTFNAFTCLGRVPYTRLPSVSGKTEMAPSEWQRAQETKHRSPDHTGRERNSLKTCTAQQRPRFQAGRAAATETAAQGPQVTAGSPGAAAPQRCRRPFHPPRRYCPRRQQVSACTASCGRPGRLPHLTARPAPCSRGAPKPTLPAPGRPPYGS